jgi:hypothetical protein
MISIKQKELSKLIKANQILRILCFLLVILTLSTISACKATSTSKQIVKPESESETKSEKVVQTVAEERPEDKIAKLTIQTPKNAYNLGEAIPLNLSLKVGDFDLKLPKFSVEDQTLLSKIEVKSEEGTIVPPLKTLVEPRPQSQNLEGKIVRLKPGIEIKARNAVDVSTNNILKYYDLKKPGKYTFQCNVVLEVYREMIEEKPRRVRELEQEIAEIDRNAKIPAESKATAIQTLREEIQDALAEQKGPRQQFVVLDTYRGKAEIRSNVVEVTVK